MNLTKRWIDIFVWFNNVFMHCFISRWVPWAVLKISVGFTDFSCNLLLYLLALQAQSWCTTTIYFSTARQIVQPRNLSFNFYTFTCMGHVSLFCIASYFYCGALQWASRELTSTWGWWERFDAFCVDTKWFWIYSSNVLLILGESAKSQFKVVVDSNPEVYLVQQLTILHEKLTDGIQIINECFSIQVIRNIRKCFYFDLFDHFFNYFYRYCLPWHYVFLTAFMAFIVFTVP